MTYKLLKNEKELFAFLSRKIENSKGRVVIQAGHFALIHSDRENLTPAIIENLTDEDLKDRASNHPYIGRFPTETWTAALKLAADNKRKDIKISIIVNDWQWVNKDNIEESNICRDNFYSSNNKLPENYRTLLEKYNLKEDVLLQFQTASYCHLFFGEQRLRKIAKKQYKSETFSETGSGKSCAFGYMPFLEYVCSNSADLLISFVPKTCKLPIDYATDDFTENKGNKLSVVNVFLSGVFHENFFENTELSTFNL